MCVYVCVCVWGGGASVAQGLIAICSYCWQRLLCNSGLQQTCGVSDQLVKRGTPWRTAESVKDGYVKFTADKHLAVSVLWCIFAGTCVCLLCIVLISYNWLINLDVSLHCPTFSTLTN